MFHWAHKKREAACPVSPVGVLKMGQPPNHEQQPAFHPANTNAMVSTTVSFRGAKWNSHPPSLQLCLWEEGYLFFMDVFLFG